MGLIPLGVFLSCFHLLDRLNATRDASDVDVWLFQNRAVLFFFVGGVLFWVDTQSKGHDAVGGISHMIWVLLFGSVVPLITAPWHAIRKSRRLQFRRHSSVAQ